MVLENIGVLLGSTDARGAHQQQTSGPPVRALMPNNQPKSPCMLSSRHRQGSYPKFAVNGHRSNNNNDLKVATKTRLTRKQTTTAPTSITTMVEAAMCKAASYTSQTSSSSSPPQRQPYPGHRHVARCIIGRGGRESHDSLTGNSRRLGSARYLRYLLEFAQTKSSV